LEPPEPVAVFPVEVLRLALEESVAAEEPPDDVLGLSVVPSLPLELQAMPTSPNKTIVATCSRCELFKVLSVSPRWGRWRPRG